MPYDILHKHGKYYKNRTTYIKLNSRPLSTLDKADEWARKHVTSGSYKFVPHSKVKPHPESKTNKSFKGLYYIQK